VAARNQQMLSAESWHTTHSGGISRENSLGLFSSCEPDNGNV
jgi:hypothetical protein